MATDQQVALTRSHRIPSTPSHISKAARQVVPAFLQKLYEMVNDPNNAELIRWSETGDSFFVLDHERFAHEVLGRWFKHRNFSSFVRQLNMYGFHKIPHLQQGVLKSDTETEFWNFAHANFHRGQPDLLCLIQRKKQTPQQGDEPAIELRDATNNIGLIAAPNQAAVGTAPGTAALSNGQVLDVHSIVSGINAIKRHQTTISAELNELKRSNQHLWQDALTTRTRHQKQQDTINRIVKFLAGVFGSHPGAAVAGVGVPGGTQSVGNGQGNQDKVDGANAPRRRMRLMIEDAKRDGPAKGTVEEPPQRSKPVSAETQEQQQEQQISRAVTPNRSPIEFQNILNQLSPSQIQLLLTSLATQTITDPSSGPDETINPNATSLTQYQPHFDFSQANSSSNHLPLVDSLIPFDTYDPQLPGDSTHSVIPSGQQEHEQQMEQQWRAADEIDQDVNTLDTSINSLIQTFGLDPALFDETDQNQNEPGGGASTSHATPSTAEFDFESLFNSLSNDSSSPRSTLNPNVGIGTVGMDYGGVGMGSGAGDLTSVAFLDEVHTPTTSSDMTASPSQALRHVSPGLAMGGTSDAESSPAANLSTMNANGTGVATFSANTTGKGAGGRKRKSEVVTDGDHATAFSEATKGMKLKRRKDK